MSDVAVERALAYLRCQGEQQFAEARHQMVFPHAAGFTGRTEKQSGDVFARATLGNLLLDIAALTPAGADAASLRVLARREADYLAGARLSDRGGGWSYFPGLPELPPDADTLSAVLSLFVRSAPEHIALCDGPVDIVLAGLGDDGSLETWIVAATDAPQQRQRMRWAIEHCWGTGTDPDVLAHFCHALFLRSRDRYAEAIRRGVTKLMALQAPDGSWKSTWYTGRAFGTGLALRLLRETGTGDDARAKAHAFLLAAQGPDGTWGDPVPTPLETALSVSALVEAGDPPRYVELARAQDALVRRQFPDGSWPASPWIQMEIGRATGRVFRTLTYQSTTLTTAFCLKAVLLGRARPTAPGGAAGAVTDASPQACDQ